MRLFLFALLGVFVWTGVAAAATDGTYRGKTSQGFPVSAKVVDGRLTRIHFRWRAACGHDTVYRAFTTWFDGKDHVIEQDGKTFSDSGTVRNRFPRRHMTIVRHERIAGSFDADRLSGTHKTTVKVRRRGKLEFVCKSSIRFKGTRR